VFLYFCLFFDDVSSSCKENGSKALTSVAQSPSLQDEAEEGHERGSLASK
jgi:hypothetical protein